MLGRDCRGPFIGQEDTLRWQGRKRWEDGSAGTGLRSTTVILLAATAGSGQPCTVIKS